MKISNIKFQISSPTRLPDGQVQSGSNKYQSRKTLNIGHWRLEIGHFQSGFTFIELIVAMAIIAVLTGLITINLTTVNQKASLSSAINTLAADIKSQQIYAISGFTIGQPTASPYGVYFEQNRYTLFKGTTFTPGDSYNKTVDLKENIEFNSIQLPSPQIVFSQVSGEVADFNPALARITIRSIQSLETKTIHFNRYGVITQIN